MRQQPIGRVVADLSLPGMNGLELIRRIGLLHPAVLVPVLVLVPGSVDVTGSVVGPLVDDGSVVPVVLVPVVLVPVPPVGSTVVAVVVVVPGPVSWVVPLLLSVPVAMLSSVQPGSVSVDRIVRKGKNERLRTMP